MGNKIFFRLILFGISALMIWSVETYAQGSTESQSSDRPVHLSLSHLLQEDTVYNFYISRIIPIQAGCLIEATTFDIPLMQVRAYIAFPYRTAWHKCSVIKVGKSFPLRVLKYTEDNSLSPFEGYRIIDVLLGDKTLRIEERGLFSYIFTSPDITKYPSCIRGHERQSAKFEQLKDSLQNTVRSFLNILSYENNVIELSAFADTNKLKHSVKEHGMLYRSYNGYADFQQRLPSKKTPKFDWTGIHGVNPNDFVQTMEKISYLDGYTRQNDSVKTLNISTIQLLYAEGHKYTFRVIWRYSKEESPSSSAIMTAKYSRGKWQISGLKARSFKEMYREFL